MQPSSLIFLVIVAIWVAYLIQHWVRRREHLATARSVDRFSEAMRVLERRTPLPATMLATAGGGPTGPAARPEVVVKRASVSSPLRARTAADDGAAPVHAVPPIELVPHRTSAQILLRRVRGVLFLAALVAAPATIVLSAIHILKWLSVVVALGALVAVLVWLRLSAIHEHKARRARRAELRRLERLRASGQGASAASRTAAATTHRSQRPHPVTSPPQTSEAVAERGATPFDAAEAGGATEATRAAQAAQAVASGSGSGGSAVAVDPDAWQPVPVPPPTYTLKDPAHRSEPAARPVPIEVEDDEIETMAAVNGRRIMGG